MASRYIIMEDCAYTDWYNQSTSYYNPQWIRTHYYVWKSQGVNASIYGACIRFKIPTLIKYKKITKVTLNFYAQSVIYDDPNKEYLPPEGKLNIKPYIFSGDLSQLNYTNRNTLGVIGQGEIIGVEKERGFYIHADITGQYLNNTVKNGGEEWYTCFVLYGNDVAGMKPKYTEIKGKNSGDSPYLIVYYEDVEQLPPTPLTPINTVIKENNEITFAWQFNSETEAVQQSYTLAYKMIDSDTWVEHIGGAEHTYKLSEGLAQGEYEWKVRITNDASEISAYSSVAKFTVKGKPAAPYIFDAENTCLTTLYWRRGDQTAAEIELTDSEGNLVLETIVPSSESSYKVNQFFKGQYNVAVRIKNDMDMWSDWSNQTIIINADGPEKKEPEIVQNGANVEIYIDVDDETNVAIMRAESNGEYKCIGLAEEGKYIDKTARAGINYRYIARLYKTGGYTDSTPKTAVINFDGMILSSDNGLELHLTQSSEKFLSIKETVACDSASTNYAGREFPLIERSEFVSWGIERKFFVTAEEKELLDYKLLKMNNIRYRDSRGRSFNCAVTGISYSEYMDVGYIATISIIRTDEEEVKLNV